MSNARTLWLLLLCLAVGRIADAAPPNVIVILADDIGYGDLGCYGATQVATPNLDRLARQGTRFTDAHSPAAVCTPSRYALLTGQYAWRHPPAARILSGVAPLAIPLNRSTVASLLKKAGYATAVVGKWHLGLGSGPTDYNHIDRGPRDAGFDHSFIIPATGDRTPCVYVENQQVAGYDPSDPIQVRYGEPIGNEPTGAANPELLKVKPSHGHDNTIVNGISRIGFMAGGRAARWTDEDMADAITRRAVEFIESRQRPFFLYFATHDIHVPRVPHPRFAGTSKSGTRGDVIQQLDWCVGQILAALDRHQLVDDTLLIFSSDNGGVMDDGYQDGSAHDTSGHRCNGALRGYKGGLYEGGTRVPFIARWPGRIQAGTTCDQLISLVDLMATCADIVGAKLDVQDAPDSVSILPILEGKGAGGVVREYLVEQAGNGRLAIRHGTWKLIPTSPNRTTGGGAELFQLADDLGEEHNLAAEHPDKVRELSEVLARIRTAGRSRDLTP